LEQGKCLLQNRQLFDFNLSTLVEFDALRCAT